MLALAVLMMAPSWGWGQTYTKLTSLAELSDGYYVILNESDAFVMTNGRSGSATTGYFVSAAITPSNGTITDPAATNVWKIETNGTGRTIYNEAIAKYVGWSSSNAASIEDAPANTNRWTFTYADSKFTVLNVAANTRQLSYNSGSPRFAAYANNAQQELQFYKMGEAPTTPTIILSETSLSGFTYVDGNGPSTEQTFTVEGTNLTNDISILASTHYEISKTSGTGYAIQLTFTPAEVGTAQTVYVRLKAGLADGTYDNEAITATSAGAADKTVTCSGTVTAPPPPDAPNALTADPIGATGFTANWGAVTGATNYNLDVYTVSGTVSSDLFISEYGEGSSNNKYIEIYNGTGTTVDLSEYTLKQSYNGTGWSGNPFSSYNLPLTGSLANNDVFVIAASDANATILAQTDMAITYHASDQGGKVVSFTGNDAMGLFKNEVLIDVFGDPSSSATIPVAGFSTYGQDHTIVRKSSINGGNTNWTSSSGTNTTDSEWAGYAQDTWTYLGSHTMDGAGLTTYVPDYENLDVGNVTSYNVTGLTSGTTYYYVVRATNTYGTSANSNEIEVTTTGTANNAPIIANIVQTPETGINSSTTVSVSADVTDADANLLGIELQWGTASGSLGNSIDMSKGTGDTYTTDTDIPAQTAGTTVYYVVYALDDEMAEATSPEQSYFVHASEPTNHATTFMADFATPAYSTIDVVWDDATGGTLPEGYVIKASDVSYDAITAPVDGTPEIPDALVQIVEPGMGEANFTGLNDNTTYYFKIWPFTNTGANINYKTDGAVPQAEATTAFGVPIAPVATAATLITSAGFTANWDPVTGATGYELDVYTKAGSAVTTILSENFDGFLRGTPDGGAFSTDISGTIDTYTQTPGWNGDKVYEAGETAKMGSSSALGYIVTPEINLSGNSGNFSVSFEAMAWSGDATNLKVFHNGVLAHTVTNLNNTDYTLAPFEVNLTGGTSTSKLRFEAEKASKSRFFLENLLITQGSETNIPIEGSPFTISGGELTRRIISGLDQNTTYYYVVRAINDAGTSSNSNEIEVTTGIVSAKETIVSGDWNNPSIWTNGIVPVATDDVTIKHTVTLSATGTANSRNFTIDGGSLNIVSDATGTGSLISTGTVTGNVTVQRYMPGASEAWHLLSSPVANQAISGEFIPTGTYDDGSGYDFYAWSEPTETWLNQKEAANQIETFNPGQGYLVAYQLPDTKTFAGQLNAGSVSFNLKHENSGDYRGSNLMGNPYASGIDWNLADRSKFHDEFAYVYNSAKEGGEGYINVDGISTGAYIGVNQGFMVLAKPTENNATFNFTNDMRVHGGNFYKNTNSTDQLKVRFANASNYDETSIRLMSESDFNRDRNDAVKMFSYNPAIPQVYTLTSDLVGASINTVPSINEEAVFPICLYVPAQDNYVISLPLAEGEFSGRTVYLQDKLTGGMVNLSNGQTYAFAASPSDNTNRFELRFSTLGIDKPEALDAIFAFAYGDVLYLETTSKEAAQVNVYNLTGQLVMQGKTNGNTLSTFNASALSNGVYVVNVILNKGVVSQKIVIRK